MKSKIFLFVFLLAGFLLANFSAYEVYGQKPQNVAAKQQFIMYTCSMHPEIVQDHPGNCPRCGMKLIEKKEASNVYPNQENDSIKMKHDPMMMQRDSTMMKKEKMMCDTTQKKHD